jgi:hypothetical protein
MNRRWRAVGVGLISITIAAPLVVAVALTSFPGLLPAGVQASFRSLATALDAQGRPTLLLAGIGGVVLLLEAVRVLYRDSDGGGTARPARVPVDDRLGARSVEVTGTEYNEELADAIESMDLFDERPARDPETLEAIAVRVLGRSEGWSPREARTRLATGTWTDDPRAAMVFADITPPLRIRILDRFRRQHRYERAVEAALSALENHAETAGSRGANDE